ncbi:hypothetical protein EHS25_007517 [Saitozyma podzolica]|uniref:DUF7727 domain-containing protein n=1 Tax=Saitozyma podzolica TaxID=1890683 RepID=A0A427YPX2_9TREE|nr:hypothetical protein EHS25_007517 [Saitozyma podzolica]
MGQLVYHEWARLLALSSAAYMLWASFWAFLFRKFFWDMIGGTLGPAGIIPGSNTAPLVFITTTIPLLQIFSLLLSIVALALEWPLPMLRRTAIHRSLTLRVVLYFLTAFVGIMVYQTVDCAIYFAITSGVYVRAMMRGETMAERGGQAWSDA